MFPQIKNNHYHNMSWDEIKSLQNDIVNGKYNLLIKQTQLMLYLNQMNPSYKRKLVLIQNLSILFFIGFIILIFFNLLLSLLSFLTFIFLSILNQKEANKLIYKNCIEDYVFLKFALSVELVSLEKIKNY